MIASFAMALRYAFNLGAEADRIEQEISAALGEGLGAADSKSEGTTVVGTRQMGDAIIAEMEQLQAA